MYNLGIKLYPTKGPEVALKSSAAHSATLLVSLSATAINSHCWELWLSVAEHTKIKFYA